jgi:uncharacterized membrane protein YjgN (DUF898 family)
MADTELLEAKTGTKTGAALPKGVSISVTYVPRPGLLSLAIVNFLLNVITLSIYRFWARTKVRRHIWSSIHINGEPLEYTGTGKELFLGALIVFGLLIMPIVLLFVSVSLWFGPQHPVLGLLQFMVTVLILLLTGMAIYRARRYRLSRTLWRGIRGTLIGSAWSYSLLYFGSLLLKGLTLGWSTPAMNVELQKRITRDMRFGQTPFTFRGSPGPLYPAYAVGWFGAIAALALGLLLGGGALWSLYYGVFKDLFAEGRQGDLHWVGSLIVGVLIAGVGIYLIYGIVWTLYQAREMNAFAAYTGFDRARFRLNATAPSLIGLWIGNVLIFIFTLSIASPLILQRNIRYFCDRLTVDGMVDIESIRQSSELISKRGEGLADAFDIDGF